MSRIVDLFGSAGRASKSVASSDRRRALAPRRRGPSQIMAGRQDMMRLFASIESLLPGEGGRLIQLASSIRGEGTTTVAHDLATVVTEMAGRRVLLVDANLRSEGLHARYGCTPALGLEQLEDEAPFDEAVQEIEPDLLYLAGLAIDQDGARLLFDPDRLDRVFDRLRRTFDLILLDTPPILGNVAGVALARKADGVILVVEAERTRAPVVSEARRMLETNAGRVIGAVMNKRRKHIPDFLYRRL